MSRHPFGWSLPPGVTDRMIDEAAGAFDDDFSDMEEEPEEDEESCINPGGHEFVCSGTNEGGDDDSYHGEGRSYCQWCGKDGDA